MEIILSEDQMLQIRLLVANIIQQEIEYSLNNYKLNSPYMNKKQTCDFLGISNNTLDSWINKGLPVIQIERTVRFEKTKISRWMDRQQLEK